MTGSLDELAELIARFLAMACPDEIVGDVDHDGPLFRRIEVSGRSGRFMIVVEEIPRGSARMTGRPTAIVPVERYVAARELAVLMGVSTTTVKRMVAAGMPSETWGMSRTRRFLPSSAMAWAHERATMTAARNGARNAPGEHQPKE